METKKVLIIRFSSIGDIVLTSPIIRCIKKQLKSEVHFVVKKRFLEVLKHNPYIDKLYGLEDVRSIIPELKKEHYDVVIDLQKNAKSIFIRKRLGRPSFSFNKLNVRKWLLVNFKVNTLPDIHLVDRYFEGVRSLGIKNDGEGLDYFISKNDEESVTEKLKGKGKYTVLVLGATYTTKRIPLELTLKILDEISTHVILIGGKDVAEESVIIKEKFTDKVTNLVASININESAAIIKNADTIITGDTGMMHIAAAYRKKICTIWGNTVPAFGMFPYYGNAENKNTDVQVENLSCRPCSKLGHAKCPRGHFKCMRAQKLDFLDEISSQ